MSLSIMWRRDGEVVERKVLIDYVCVDERVRKSVVDAKVYRGIGGGVSDHYVVVVRLKAQMKWVKRARGGREGRGVRMRVERLQEEEYNEEFRRVVERRLEMFNLEQMEEVDECSLEPFKGERRTSRSEMAR
ncbi:hypothetical protein Pmani_025063 [Petrolisthes manimaculis]|uniref:Uncharacterized protein n=1 Tax=Petrolisthes manimaculis TaxID=1843537 RepID=A0AAE1TY36_9EUCA|nr:hypothetical protein Pmani_025063 [Petrolisthes manimaculis]